MKKTFISILLILVGVFAVWYFYGHPRSSDTEKENRTAEIQAAAPVPAEKTDRIETVEIKDGDTYGKLMTACGLDYAAANAIYEAALPHYDLAKIRVGRALELVRDKDTDEVKELRYKIDTEDELCATLAVPAPAHTGDAASGTVETELTPAPVWTASVSAIPYEVRIKTVTGKVESSMYQAALDNNIDIRAIIELANAFQWTIDFAMDPRQGDTFKFIYEERYLDGEYVMPGQILAGHYINDGTKFEVYYFEESADNIGFFDEKGNAAQRMFLKAPVEFRYISSGFTTGLRYIEKFNISTGHRAIDYAAAAGTPIRSVGDGTVTFAARNGAYGNMITVRHNGTYTTNYAHQSRFAVKKGAKVKQGQIIGYVGSTGLSTGPHLHYEMLKNGAKINPLLEIQPPGEPIKEANRARFFETITPLQEQLNAAE